MAPALKVRIFNFFRSIFKLAYLESGLARLTNEKPTCYIFCKLVPNPYQYNKPSFRHTTRHGIRITVDLSDYVGHYYFFGFKDLSHKRLFEICKEDFNVLDIGANIGFTVLKLAQLVKNGKVIGFEPDPYNYSACINNLKQNNFDNSEVLNLGLGSEEAILDMEVRTPSNRGGNRISTSLNKDGIKIQVKKLDGLFPALDMDHLDLIKIDVEGYELRVLKGSEEILKKYKPILFIELDNDNLMDQGDSAQALIDFLTQLGYKSIYNAETNQPLEASMDFSHCHYDIIAQ